MFQMNDAYARAVIRARLEQAEQHRLASQVVSARRWQRLSEVAACRADKYRLVGGIASRTSAFRAG
jgi:hypothetical protein